MVLGKFLAFRRVVFRVSLWQKLGRVRLWGVHSRGRLLVGRLERLRWLGAICCDFIEAWRGFTDHLVLIVGTHNNFRAM